MANYYANRVFREFILDLTNHSGSPFIRNAPEELNRTISNYLMQFGLAYGDISAGLAQLEAIYPFERDFVDIQNAWFVQIQIRASLSLFQVSTANARYSRIVDSDRK